MLGFNRLSIQSKMLILLLLVSLASIGAVAISGYSSAKSALSASIENQLQGIRVAKTSTLKAMLNALSDQVVSMSDSQVVIEGMRSFKQAYRDLGGKSLSPSEEEKLKEFYTQEFLPALSKQIDAQPTLETYLPNSNTARYLQYHYLANNPEPYGQKQLLITAPNDRSSYGEAHSKLHKMFARAVKIFGFEDLLLVDPDTLDVVYSYQKTTEFGTNLSNGPYANTNLADRARAIKVARDRDDFKVADFEPYRPSLGSPMGFVMSPIFDGAVLSGILVLQFPIDAFNQVLSGNYNWQEEGLGQTGETFVVGSDKTIRSRSRFMHEDPQGFLKDLRKSGTSSMLVDKIERQNTVMNILPLSNSGVERALDGMSGIIRTRSYRGREVLSAYGPLELDSLRWAVIAEMDLEEATAPIRLLGRRVAGVSTAIALLVSVLALICSQVLTRPLRLLTEGAKRLGAGETEVRVNLNSKDEFGELGRVFNEMASNISEQTKRLEEQVKENQELLLSILPASAVAQRQEGDERASREFSDLSVLFAEIQGMEEFGKGSSDSKALLALSDLVAAFDEAAERWGIEKVKTIGAAYLAACGLSVSRPDHTRRVAQFAQEMRQIVERFNREQRAELSINIGLNSGPVVGGVVGKRKFLYDLWGDTVSIARKLCRGERGSIKVTATVFSRLGEQFEFKGPFVCEIQGRENIEAWQLSAWK